jgi:hypothetical protein
MITLLIALFICIITFASKEPERYSKKLDSLMYGTGGTGIAGLLQRGMEQDSVLWRKRPMRARSGNVGSEMPPLHSDASLESTAEILRRLDGPTPGTLEDSYAMRVPISMLFGSDQRLSPGGRQLFQVIANNIRALPYDIQLQVNNQGDVPKAVVIAKYLWEQLGIAPSRTGVGTRTAPRTWGSSLWIIFHRRRA